MPDRIIVKYTTTEDTMATKAETADYLVGQIKSAGEVYARKMFGEYGMYCDGRMIALICDDQLFIKPTVSGRNYLDNVEEAPPYPGSKDWFLIPEDNWDDEVWLSELVRITTAEVPLPKPKKPRQKK